MNVFKRRRDLLKEHLREAAGAQAVLALIFSGAERDLVPFVPDSNFYYLTGVESPGAALLLNVTPEGADEVLFLPPKDPAKERWTGPVLSSGGLTKEVLPDRERKRAMKDTGVGTILAAYQLEAHLSRPLDKNPLCYLDFPAAGLDDPPTQTHLFWEKIHRRYPALHPRRLGALLGDLRRVKDETELACLVDAIDITRAAHDALMRHISPGMMEYQAAALVEFVFRMEGAQTPAFPTIIGSGPNSCVLHYDKNSRKMSAGDLAVCDIGCRKDFYCSDITRTYPISGRYSKRQREIYDVVLGASQAAMEAARPGNFVTDVHRACSEYIARAGYGRYFFHGTSHYLGLDAHDAGLYDRPLEPGVVITIEPGIYIASEELGIRTEDDIVITKAGYRCLTEDVPRDPGDIEKLMSRPSKSLSY